MIEETEADIAALEAEIADPDTARDYEKLSALCAALEEKKDRHEEILAEWTELSELI